MPKMTFVIPGRQSRKEVEAPIGLSVLEIAHRNDIDLEGAARARSPAPPVTSSSDPEWYDQLAEPSEEEEDMLDLAFGLTHTSGSAARST